MHSNHIMEILQANIEALEQGLNFLTDITDEQFVHVCTPYVHSTIGEHIRHVLDMYVVLKESVQSGLVDYDRRCRGSNIEFQRSSALAALQEAIEWTKSLSDNISAVCEKKLSIKSEVRLEPTAKTSPVKVDSSLARELIFVSSHAVHHYALISVIARLQGLEVGNFFGIAPATVSYLRNEAACAP